MNARMLALALGVAVCAAPAAALETVDEIEACMKRNFPEKTSVQTIVLTSQDRIGATTTMRAKIYWRKGDDGKSKVVLRLSDPPDMRGSAILVLEKKDQPDMFMYLPELQSVPGSGGRVKRITGRMMSGSMFGTDFSYEEFQRLQQIEGESYTSERLPDADVGGRAAYVIQSTWTGPAADKPAVDRTVVRVDRENCVPLEMEFFERGDQLRKRLTTDTSKIEAMGARHIARRMEMSDVRDGTKTELVVEEIELEADLSDSVFTTRWLESQGAKSF